MNLDDKMSHGWFHKSMRAQDVKYHYFRRGDELSICGMSRRERDWKHGTSYGSEDAIKRNYCQKCVEICNNIPDLRSWKRPSENPKDRERTEIQPSYAIPPKRFELMDDKLYYHKATCSVCGKTGIYPSSSPVPTPRLHNHIICPGAVA